MRLLKTIGKSIVFVVDGIAWCCAGLLIAFGLWIPALYSLIFLFVRLNAGVPFQGFVEVLFYLGLGLSSVGGFAFSYYIKKRKKLKNEKMKEQTYAAKGSHRTDLKEKALPSKDYYEPISEDYAPYKKQYAKVREEYVSPKQEVVSTMREYAPSRQEYTPAKQEYAPINKEYEPAKQQYAPTKQEYLPRRKEENTPEYDERPLIFALKSEKNMYVYEYSDRLQFYKRRGDSMKLVHIEYKDKW